MLCQGQAVEIYKLKISIMADLSSRLEAGNAGQWMRGKSIPVAVQYGVTSRAIRDIWNRKTWAYASKHLWAEELKYSCNSTELHVEVSTNSSLFRMVKCSLKSAQVREFCRHPGRPKGSRDSKPRMKTSRLPPKVKEDILAISLGNSEGKSQLCNEPDNKPHWMSRGSLEFHDPFHADWPYW